MDGRRKGRGKKKMRLLAEIYEVIDRASTAKSVKQQTIESKLPRDLLQLILSKITLRDNICASAVNKRWLDVAISVRKANKPPLLMILPKSGYIYEFYDPSRRKSYWLELQELHGSRVCYTKHGWLLMSNPRTRLLFFFSPYTRDWELITLPYKDLHFQPIAFSVAPTATNCIVFTIGNVGFRRVVVSTCRPGETQWTTIYPESNPSFFCQISNKIVFRDGLFHCFSLPSTLGIYNPDTLGWTVHSIPAPRCPHDRYVHDWFQGKYVVENDGRFLLIITSDCNPVIYSLELTEDEPHWLMFEPIEGLTLFASYVSSLGRTAPLGTIPERVYFPKVLFYGKQCVSYSVRKDRYYLSDQWYNWEEKDPSYSVRIEPPEILSVFQ